MTRDAVRLTLRRALLRRDWIAAERLGRRLAGRMILDGLRRLWGAR